jgi:hypothetical protein
VLDTFIEVSSPEALRLRFEAHPDPG